MFILESKEINEHLSFRQSKSPTHDELVLLLYKNQSNKRKADEELRLSDIKKSKNFMSDSTADMHTAASLPPAILQSLNEAGLNLPENLTPAQNQEQDNTYTIFNQQTHEIKQFTQNFFADEMIVHNEPKGLVYTNASALNLPTLGSNLTGIDDRFTQRKPRQRAEIDDVSSLLSNFKKKLKSNTNPAKKTKFLRDSSLNGHDSSYEPGKSDPEDDEDHNSYQTEDSDSDYESAAKKAKNPRAKNKGAGGKPSKYVAIDYETHDHLEAVNFRVPDSTTRFKCAICDVDVVYHGKYGLNAHIKKIHPNFWEKYKHKFVEVRRSMAEEAEAMEEIIIDPITKKYTCKLCGKDWDRPNGCVLHVNRVHLKKTEGVCKYCNKEFSSLANLRMHEMTHTDTYSHYCEYCGKGVRKLVWGGF